MSCNATETHSINNDAKLLKVFLDWLLSGKLQADMLKSGRTFRRKTSKFWQIWAMPPLIDETYHVVYVDGIYIGRQVVVLIARSEKHVLGWYLARTENSRAWKALMDRISPPDVVVSDGGADSRRQGAKHGPARRCSGVHFTRFAR
jgi:hypothetical protein